MKPLVKHRGIVAPLNKSNVDTDQIIPKQFLKKIERSGFGKHLFHDWRFLDEEGKKENPEFILNREPYRQSSILLAGENFGCGSSREHAPWALHDFGFRIIIAPSFADIFYNNCFKNGMLPMILSKTIVNEMLQIVGNKTGIEFDVDLESQTISLEDKSFNFEIDSFRKDCLINGWDDIGLALRYADKIDEFEKKYTMNHPYMISFEA